MVFVFSCLTYFTYGNTIHVAAKGKISFFFIAGVCVRVCVCVCTYLSIYPSTINSLFFHLFLDI